jgi:hypothetical protein
MASLVRALSSGQLEILKKADPRTTHLEFFNDYLFEAIKRLESFIQNSNDLDAKKEAALLIEIVQNKMSQKSVTYQWILEFSSSYAYLFSGGKNASDFHSIARENQILMDSRSVAVRMYSSGLIAIPTFAKQSFNSYFAMEGKDFTVLGMRESDQTVDGQVLSPMKFLIHDYGHAELVRLSKVSDKYKKEWIIINQKISDGISKLKKPQRKATEALYFFILHEEPSLKRKLLEYFEGDKSTKIPSFFDPTFYLRIRDQKDIGGSFPNQKPEEVVSQAESGFTKVLKQIEIDSNN